MSDKFGIKLSFASCFHPRSTAKVERQNQNILNLLKCLTKDHPDQWPKFLTTACNVINNTPNSISKITPSQAVFGRDTSCLVDIDWNKDERPLSSFIEEMKSIQTWAITQARSLKRAYDEREQAKHNANKQPSRMPENATVYWRKPSLPDPKANEKLQTPIKKWQAFDIRNQSCRLRDPVTNDVYKHRVTLSQLVFPSKHDDNTCLLNASAPPCSQ